MGEPFYKLAGHYALYLVKDKLAKHLEPIQLAHSPGGPERAVHLIQGRLELGGASTILLKTDFDNAYNRVHRSLCLRELYAKEDLKFMWRMANWAYGSPSSLLLMDNGSVCGTINSEEGVRQGCVLAASLYALGTLPTFARGTKPTKDVQATAIMDDLNLIGPPDSVMNF